MRIWVEYLQLLWQISNVPVIRIVAPEKIEKCFQDVYVLENVSPF